jgi:hypothetical protein
MIGNTIIIINQDTLPRTAAKRNNENQSLKDNDRLMLPNNKNYITNVAAYLTSSAQYTRKIE